MSKQKHTAGPWRTQGWVPTWAYIPVHDALHNLVASLYPDTRGYGREEVEANARLIAAAPDMLEALQLQVACICDGGPSDAQLRAATKAMVAAIAKATGVSDPEVNVLSVQTVDKPHSDFDE